MKNQLKIRTNHLNFYYADFLALQDITLEFYEHQTTALIGPSGCGKSTLLRCLNRMNDLIPYSRAAGEVLLDNRNIYDPDVDVVTLRRRVGMVFQKPNPFPKTVFENIAYGPRVNGIRNKAYLAEQVEHSLKQAAPGMRSRIGFMTRPWASPEDSSSACASPEPWQWSRKCCSWMSRPQRLIPLQRRRSRI